MIKLKKHIALLLLGIFFFPIIFQSVHIVWHHPNGYKNQCRHCEKETAENTSYSFAKDVSQKENICPICEYQFSINDLPIISIFRTIIPEIACLFNEIAVQQQYNQIFSDKTPREPPVLIF